MKSRKNGNGEGTEDMQTTTTIDREPPPPKVDRFQAPTGYTEQSSDVVGFWDPDGPTPLHFIPMHAKLFDSNLEPQKVSAIIIGAVVDPLDVSNSRDEIVHAEQGELVGVWAKPGMSAIRDLAGEKVFLYQDGEISTGKPNPMKTYKVLSQKKGQPLPILGDYRKKSKTTATFLVPESQGGSDKHRD